MEGSAPREIRLKAPTQNPLTGNALKEEVSSFDVALLVSELSPRIGGARVNNIYQIEPKILLLKLRQPNQPHIHMLIEAGKRLNITSYLHEKPKRPSAFCMALRKHLRNGVIQEIKQHEFERIVTIQVTTKEGEFQIVAELFGHGNIILVSPEHKILQALTYRRMKDRNILRGETFQHAPTIGKNPLELCRQDFDKMTNLGEPIVARGLTKFLSIGGQYAEEILLRGNVNKDTQCDRLSEGEIDRVFHQLQELLTSIKTGAVEPCVVVDAEGQWIDATPLPLEKYAAFRCKRYETLNKALDEYYAQIALRESAGEISKEAESQIAEQQRVLNRQQSALKRSEEEIERNRTIGDLIYTHFSPLQFLLEKVMKAKKEGKSWKQIISDIRKENEAELAPAIRLDPLSQEGLLLNVTMEGLTFPLNLRHSAQENAAHYYAKAKKAEKKLRGAEEAMQKTRTKIEQLGKQHVEQLRERPRQPPKRRTKAWYEKFRWFYSSDGVLVIGGRDATTNEIIIKRHTEPHDVVFHADIQGAPFVLIKTDGKKPPEQTMREAAEFAASYSKAWRDSLGAVDVYWVLPEQVSKTPPAGQYLKKGAFMISGPKSYLRNVSLQVAIGIKQEDEHAMVIGGPVEAIAKQSEVYVLLVPGREQSGSLAKRVKDVLAKRASEDLRKLIRDTSLEEIQRAIPLGRGSLK